MDFNGLPHIVPVCRITTAQIATHAKRVARLGGECPFEKDSPLWNDWIKAYIAEKSRMNKSKMTS